MNSKKLKKVIISTLMAAVTVVSFSDAAIAAVNLEDQHLLSPYEGNEPLFVHTPVIAPTTLDIDENCDGVGDGKFATNGGHGTTQLVSEMPCDYELILDNDYVIHWEQFTHRSIPGYGDSGENPSKYDKYTRDKFVKFPFEVWYNGEFYECEFPDESGKPNSYTGWIRIKRPSHWSDSSPNNHWINTPFYIPSYAGEITDTTKKIYYRVEAINVEDEYGRNHGRTEYDSPIHFGNEERDGNVSVSWTDAPNGANYVATYDCTCQLSGIVYDFTVVGSDNASVYSGDSYIGKHEISFASIKAEKKAGTKNRINETPVRYMLDGTITNSWNPLNTIVLTDAKSRQFKKMGAVWKGQTFSYSFKTISNLWDIASDDDYVMIYPTLYYVSSTGKKLTSSSQVKIYYKDSDSGDYIEYVRNNYPSMVPSGTRDGQNKKTSLIGSPQLKDSYYDKYMGPPHASFNTYAHYGNWVAFTDAKRNHIGEKKYLNTKTIDHCLSMIKLTSPLNLYSGEYEQLRWNIRNGGKQWAGVKKYPDMSFEWGSDVEMWWNKSTTRRTVKDYERFRMSIQSWYGQYHIPEEIYVIDLEKYRDEHGGEEFPGIYEYMKKANDGMGIRPDDPIFERGGYLIINFDIYTKKDNKQHLVYKGGNYDGSRCVEGDMWKKEDYEDDPQPGDPLADVPGFKYHEGDVIVIDLSRSTKDKFAPGIQDIN